MNISRAVRIVRQARGLTAKAVSLRAGFNANYVSGLETHGQAITVQRLCRLAEALEVSPLLLLYLAADCDAEVGLPLRMRLLLARMFDELLREGPQKP